MNGNDDHESGSGPDAARPPGALDQIASPTPRFDLSGWSLADLSSELVARLAQGDPHGSDKDLALLGELHTLLETRLDVHLNRFARQRSFDLVRPILDDLGVAGLQGKTVVDLGSGSVNPFAFGFLLLMLGAQRAYSIDPDPVQDLPRAIRALATTASWLLIDPASVIGADTCDPKSVFEHLRGFDLPLLAAGDPAGLAPDRLIHKVESIDNLSLDDGEADLVSTVSLLEHLRDAGEAVASLRRVTKVGGIGHHVIDFVDHRIYGGEVSNPFEFFTIDSTIPFVHGCNRIMCATWCELFVANGFIVERVEPCRIEPISEEERRRFVEPYRSMSRATLATVCARIVVRRVS